MTAILDDVTVRKSVYSSALLILFSCSIIGLIFFLRREDPKEAARTIREECLNAKDATQSKDCFSENLAREMQHGLPYVFAIVHDLYATDDNFQKGCHYLMHPIGKSAYARYKSGRDDFMVPDASACNYGFYHGFIAALMEDTNDIQEAKRFCNSFSPAILRERPDATNQCFHGLGHGFLEQFIKDQPTDIHDQPSIQKAFRSAVNPVIGNCDSVSTTTAERDNCISGFFHGVAMLQEAEGWAINTQDPLWLCHEVESAYKPYCFGNQHRLVIDMLPNASLKEVYSFTRGLYGSEAGALSNVIWRWAYNHATDSDKVREVIRQCNEIDPTVRTSCILGGLSRTQENGPPGEEFTAAAQYCLTGDLSKVDRTACAARSFDYFKRIYPYEQIETICKEYKSLYSEQCPSS